VPGGTLFRTSIVLKPKASVAQGEVFVGGYDSSNYLLVGNATDQQGYTYNLGVGHFSDADTHIDTNSARKFWNEYRSPIVLCFLIVARGRHA